MGYVLTIVSALRNGGRLDVPLLPTYLSKHKPLSLIFCLLFLRPLEGLGDYITSRLVGPSYPIHYFVNPLD